MSLMTECMIEELEMNQSYLEGEEISTIYFGGGTPSLLTAETILNFISKIRLLYNVIDQPEITLEANPDDLNKESLLAFKKAGINRLSIGIQSFSNEDLQWMNRTHTATQAIDCIKAASEVGFERISADLIYGIPGSDDERWSHNLQTIIASGIGHVSCYALTVEDKTALELSIRKGLTLAPDDEQTVHQFNLLKSTLESAGFLHYELSNFAQPSQESRHNSSYWAGVPYLGIGPSAHSYRNGERRWNIANNSLYISSIKAGTLPFEKEVLSMINKINERIMISLRTAAGLDLTAFQIQFGDTAFKQLQFNLQDQFVQKYIEQNTDRVTIKREGLMLADSIISRLFFEN